jgi:hypothetical protein
MKRPEQIACVLISLGITIPVGCATFLFAVLYQAAAPAEYVNMAMMIATGATAVVSVATFTVAMLVCQKIGGD